MKISAGKKKFVIVAVGLLMMLSISTLVINVGMNAAFGQDVAGKAAVNPEMAKFGYLAAAIAVGIGSLGAGLAVSAVGAAALGAMAERPEIWTKALIFAGLAEGIAIYGMIIAIMILGKI